MQSWFKYSLAFFALVLLLTGFIYVLGPASTRQAARNSDTPVGQLGPNATLTSAGEAPPTASGTTLPPATVGSASVNTGNSIKDKDSTPEQQPAAEAAQ